MRRQFAPREPALLGRGPWRVAALVPAAFAVHQLRYMLAYGAGASQALRHTGHSYLHSAVPWIVLCVALVAGSFLRRLGAAMSGQRSAARYTASLLAVWASCSVVLIAIFVGQESLEGLFAVGHPTGLAAVFGFGGWWAIPVAVCIGLVLAVWLHGARWVLAEVARRCSPARPWWSPATRARRRPGRAPGAVRAPLVAGWSGRGPPLRV